MEKVLDQLVQKLKDAFGERLVSVVLYGSAAAGDRQSRFSDWNILCVLREITRAELASSEKIFRWWREQGSPAPLLLSQDALIVGPGWLRLGACNARSSLGVPNGFTVAANFRRAAEVALMRTR